VTLSPIENTVRFGLYELDLRTLQLTKNGVKIRLPQQSIQALSLLLYLHGRYLWFSTRMEESGPWFQKAIDLQPDYALAWAGLADHYGEGIAGDVLDPRTSIVPEEQAANARSNWIRTFRKRTRPWVPCSS
jgi:hypothetical protein